MPEQMAGFLNKKIKPAWKSAFLTAVLVGLLAHLYKWTNWLPNWDGLVFRDDPQNMVGLGRWFLAAASSLTGSLELPFLNGILGLLFHSLGAVVICAIFGVEQKIPAALIGAVTVTFPAVTSLQFYLYVADGYGLAFFMACLSAFFLTRKKARPILASLLLTLSVAIYQAYLTVTVTLLLLFLFTELFFGKESVLALFRRGLLFLLSGAASVLAYYGILFLILRLTGQTLLEYQGVSSGFSPSSFSLAASLWNMGKTTLDFFFDFSQGIAFFPVFNLIFFGFTALILLGMVFTAKLPVARCLLSLLFLFLLPVGGTLLALLNAHVDYHMLMKMGFLTPYLIPLLLYEKGAFSLSWERVKR